MTVLTQIREADRHWAWKFALRVALVVFCIIPIGMMIWLLASPNLARDSTIGYGAGFFFIPLGLAIIWAVVDVGVLFGRKRPAHPGFSVGFDLVLFIAFAIAGAAFASLAIITLQDVAYYSDSSSSTSYYGYDYYSGSTPVGSDGYSGYGNSTIAYDIQNNLPYTYVSTSDTSSIRHPGDADYNCPDWDSCADQAASTSLLRRTLNVALAAAIFLCIDALIEFVLFVWGCVDCHAYNRNAVYNHRARDLAEKMISDMREKGELPPAGATAYHGQQMQPLMAGASSGTPRPAPDPQYVAYGGYNATSLASPRLASPPPAEVAAGGYVPVQQRLSQEMVSRRDSLSIDSHGVPHASSQPQQPQQQQQYQQLSHGAPQVPAINFDNRHI